MEHAARSESGSLELPLRDVWVWEEHSESMDTRSKITTHYARALSRTFSNATVTHVAVLEDDLLLSPDFLSFLYAFAPYTSANPSEGPTVVSGWNDNAAARVERMNDAVALTDFFPGLGWLLPRDVWAQLKSAWPVNNAPTTTARRLYPPSAVAPTGWDWWMRAEFEARGWVALYPSLARVRHKGGNGGANVAPEQQQALYSRFVCADESNVLTTEEWERAAASAMARQPAKYRQFLDQFAKNAAPVATLARAHKTAQAVRISLSERQYPMFAGELGLWPSPRGFLAGRLVLSLKTGTKLVLEREAVRVQKPGMAVLGGRNQSCAEVCGEASCVIAATAAWNSCTRIARRFGCPRGCVYETGADLPAIVADDAPISTRGACVVAESAASLSCDGRHEHTRRLCVCGPKKDGAFFGFGHADWLGASEKYDL